MKNTTPHLTSPHLVEYDIAELDDGTGDLDGSEHHPPARSPYTIVTVQVTWECKSAWGMKTISKIDMTH